METGKDAREGRRRGGRAVKKKKRGKAAQRYVTGKSGGRKETEFRRATEKRKRKLKLPGKPKNWAGGVLGGTT